ncbi:MAG: Phospholipid-lipopolysaccharide ABC transporter [uncultured Campylobacterales bacterium]|uniref:Phospholipid-lipopolysaccharide ABC transporter n=1 Tax=uncultured Campylobacterales bacterium TaxID=352960 RepID=A0A6S6T4P9_9BACT|nr:MAG: Phospholipid-lipopolysaccharide ABC transporter [uncultured Campylobacterales bacterium]
MAYTAKSIGKYVQVYFTSYIGQDIVRRIKDKILGNTLDFDITFFKGIRSGELISRITNDTERIRLVVSKIIPEILRESLTIVALLGVVIYQSPKLAFYSLIVLPLTLYPLRVLAKKVKKLSFSSQESISDATSILSEIFSNIELIKTSNTEAKEFDKFADTNKKFFNINIKQVKIAELTGPLMEILGSIGAAAVIIVGGMQVIDGTMNTGQFFSFMTALFLLYTPIKRISRLYNQTQDAVAASNRIFSFLETKSTIKNGTKTIQDIQTIKFEDIYMSYDNKQVLNGINIDIKKGEMIALIGDSGAGKSSIINLLARFYDSSSGQILLNDTEIKDIDIKNLRDHLAIVTQKVYIFNDTIAQNVSYGKPYDEAKVKSALKKAYLLDFVESLSEGIHTKLDESGTNLSGGQAQRISIARAFYKDPDIFIFDESTSSLDNASEKEILNIIKEIKRDKIIIMIAHKLSAIQDADKILIFSKGQIVDEGSHTQLLESSPKYQKLLNNTK